MGIFSSIRGENFELCERNSDKKIEIKRDEMIKIVHAVRFCRDHDAAGSYMALEYDKIYRKLDKALD